MVCWYVARPHALKDMRKVVGPAFAVARKKHRRLIALLANRRRDPALKNSPNSSLPCPSLRSLAGSHHCRASWAVFNLQLTPPGYFCKMKRASSLSTRKDSRFRVLLL